MELRNQRGGITPAEGCMFAAVGLFVILLMAMLYLAFIRFRNPPQPAETPATVGAAFPSSGMVRPRWFATAPPRVVDLAGRVAADG